MRDRRAHANKGPTRHERDNDLDHRGRCCRRIRRAMAAIGIDRRTGFLAETTAEYLARSIRAGHLPSRLTTATGALQVNACVLELIIERAELLATARFYPAQ